MECIVCYEPFTGSQPHPSSSCQAGPSSSSSAVKTAPSAAAGSAAAAAAASANAAIPPTPVSNLGPAMRKRSKREEQLKVAERRKVSEIICTPCGHLFHRACITGWLQKESGSLRASSGTCPNCRTKFRQSALYPVYLSFDRPLPPPPPPPPQPTSFMMPSAPTIVTPPTPASMVVPLCLDNGRRLPQTGLKYLDPVGSFATQYAKKHFASNTATNAEKTPTPDSTSSSMMSPRKKRKLLDAQSRPSTVNNDAAWNENETEVEVKVGKCLIPDCEDVRMMLEFAQRDIAILQENMADLRQKYEEALDAKVMADAQLENLKIEMQSRVNLLARGLFPE